MELTGTVKAIIYRSEDTGFTVLELTNEAGEDMTAIGEMPLAGGGGTGGIDGPMDGAQDLWPPIPGRDL